MASLQAKMFIVFALIATMPLLALSYLALSETRDALAEEVGQSHAHTAKAAAAFVALYTTSARDVIADEASRASLERAAAANDKTAVADEVARLLDRTAGAPVFAHAAFVDARGIVMASAGPSTLRAEEDASGDERFLQPRARGAPVVLPVPPDSPALLPIAAPVHHEGAFVGVLVAHMDVGALASELSTLALGQGGGLVVVDHSRRLLVHPVVSPGADWSGVVPVESALQGGPGHAVFDDPDTGVAMLAGYSAVPELQWAVLDVVPTSVAYAALTRLTAALVVLSGVLMGGILLGSVVLSRRIVQPVRDLTSAARSLSSGHLTARIDERGDDEVSELSRTFNQMADRIVESLDGLRRSESRYRNLVEAANDLIMTVEPDGTISFAGPLSDALLGRAGRELHGEPVAAILPATDRPAFEEAVRDVVERKRTTQIAHHFEPRGGPPRMFRSSLSPIFGADGEVARVLVVASDITSQQRQERFRETSFHLARIVSEATDLRQLATRGLGTLLAAAPLARGAIHILGESGLTEAARAGGALPRDAQAAADEAISSLQATTRGRVLAIPLVERGEALGVVTLEGEVGAPSADDAEALGALVSQMAVGVRRSLFEARLKEYAAQLEARVEARTSELREKSREMERFLYSVSHDLKAPVISIEGYAQALEEDYVHVLDEEGRAFLQRIRKNATLMERLILDLLELSRIGRVSETREDVDMDALFAEVSSRLDARLAAAGGTLAIAPGLPVVRGERHRLDQLFTNLLENAIKYRHPDRALAIRVTGERTQDGARFLVIDNGRGLPSGVEDKLFEIFQRLPTPAGMPDPGGTGIGLAIVKRIVDAHGGRVWGGGVEGEGAVFTIELPAWRSVEVHEPRREPA